MNARIIAISLLLSGCSSTGFMGQAARLACPTIEIAAELTAVTLSIPTGMESVPLAEMAVGVLTLPCYRDEPMQEPQA